MGKRVLVVVDMQKDFVDGSLGSKEAVSIVPAVVKKARDFDGTVLFTRDTHGEDYMERITWRPRRGNTFRWPTVSGGRKAGS